MVKVFRVEGWFKQGGWKQTFTQELRALSEGQALDRVYSEMGSKHKVKRNLIYIRGIIEIKTEEAKDPLVVALSRCSDGKTDT